MPAWSELLEEFDKVSLNKKGDFLMEKSRQSVSRVGDLYERNILYYASSFLQKPPSPKSIHLHYHGGS